MDADAKLISKLLERVQDSYNSDYYFIESCFKNENRYSKRIALDDLRLQMYLERHNSIILGGKECKYCRKGENKKKIKLKDISPQINQPDIVYNNYLLDDTWEQTDW